MNLLYNIRTQQLKIGHVLLTIITLSNLKTKIIL